MALRLARGHHVSLEQGRSMPRGLGAPVLTFQESGEAEIVPERAQGSGALMTSWGSDKVKTAARDTYLARDLSARLGWDGGWLSASSD
jgi:hypothetical protein